MSPHPIDPSDPVAPRSVGDQLDKHEVCSGECCSRICFDLGSSVALGAVDKWLIERQPHVLLSPGNTRFSVQW